jgi:hypothetical protein
MKTTMITVLAAAASVSASYEKLTTSTVYATSVYSTAGKVTTDYISLYETICSATETSTGYPVVETETAEAAHGYPTMEAAHAYPTVEAVTYAPVETTSTKQPCTSTIYNTKEYTITSCKPEVTNCPVGSKTYSVETSIYTGPATYPIQNIPWTTSVVYETKEYTITSCKPDVTNCPVGSKAYETKSFETSYPVNTVTAAGKPYPTVANKPSESYAAAAYPSQSKSVGTVTPVAHATGSYTAKNTSTPYVPVTGSAASVKVGGVLMAAGLIAALF